jgi:ribosome biogenesis GTPase
MNASLQELGFVPFFAQQISLDDIERNRVGRVIEVQRSLITVSDGYREWPVPLPSYRSDSAAEERPAVGDWVVLDDQQTKIDRVLDRKSLFRRVGAGERPEIQLIAANVDILFVVTSCNEEFKESRLERYLALAAQAGVIAVVVMTKTDLCDDPESYAERARRVHSGLHVVQLNALERSTFDGVMAWIEPGSTIALVGSSGVGKSTIVNTLADKDIAATKRVREDDKKGRHTTTHRALYRLPGGGLLIDVPGMRELKIADVDEALSSVFDDIEALASRCRFADCRHQSEPGCAVRDGVSNGDITERRLQNYLKLIRENERNSASLAEKRADDRSFSRLVKQVKTLKKKDRALGD